MDETQHLKRLFPETPLQITRPKGPKVTKDMKTNFFLVKHFSHP